jgi:DNA (cytosine-5)-methyltransferase 1
MQKTIKALDLFAGTGWGVACQQLGIDEAGVELMPAAIATREANGMHTLYCDVWDGLQNPVIMAAFYKWCADGGSVREFYEMLIASPPCQTFSMAGHGAGRAALDEVLEAIRLHAYKDPAALRAFGEKHDMRTALVLTPLAHVWRDRPRLVALEQVPTVLPVWEACADVMRGLGYSVAVGVLQAEQYGVPQTRKRAILVARLDGEARLPEPTHSAFYPTDPERLDPGVKKWVSIAEALGYTDDEAAGSVFTQNNKLAHQAVRRLDQPAPTVTAGHDSGNRGFIDEDGNFFVATVEQVAALQSYPAGFAWAGSKTKTMLQIGNAVPPLLAETVLTALVQPAVAALPVPEQQPLEFAA